MKRNLKRLARAKENIAYGKISGAVGTYAHLSPAVEEYVCKKCGLKPAPISNQIIQDHKGYISVESQVNEGSTFFVNLPLNQEHPKRRKGDLENHTDLLTPVDQR
jgi:adenylosuccinate lyase